MPLHIISSDRKKKEKRAARYMREVREIVKAKLSRRELLRMGLVMGGAGAAAFQGVRNFKPHWAYADTGSGDGDALRFRSPPNTPFVDPLPIPFTMQPVTLNPSPTKGTNPAPSAVTNFAEAARPDHQHWERFNLPNPAVDMYESVERAVLHDFYPDVDGVPPSTIWAYVEESTGRAGLLRIEARYGKPVIHRVHNALPADNGGFGLNQTATHLHGGHTASESDGGPTHFYDAGKFRDYLYLNVRPGFVKTHPETTWNGKTVPGDVRETQSFLWFHDHRFDFTAQNVYKGLASLYTLYSDDILLDTGDETTGLRLPSGEFDIPLVFTDKVFDPATGQQFFDVFNVDGILGDRFAVNGKLQPFLEVKRRKYRFRILDGGPARVYEFFLSNGDSFVQLSTDGNLLPRPLFRRSIRLEPAERTDVIIDFSNAKIGDRIYLQNRLEHTDGRGPTGEIIAPTNLVEFRVTGDVLEDPSRVPVAMLDLPERNIQIARTRRWDFGRSQGVWEINGEIFEPDKISAFPKQDTAEIWTFKSGGGWLHPVHNHMEEFLVLTMDGNRPPDEYAGRKDTIGAGENVIGDDNIGEVKILVQFRDFLGDYPLHCHNNLHEDHAMMVRWQVVP